jgi:hypothetical protein
MDVERRRSGPGCAIGAGGKTTCYKCPAGAEYDGQRCVQHMRCENGVCTDTDSSGTTREYKAPRR